MRGQRLKRYDITGNVLPDLLSPGTHRVETGIPKDAETRRLGYDHTEDKVFLVVEHESFDPVEEGMEIPRGEVTLTTVRTEEPTHHE